jgi:hypothetical protein
MAMSMRFLRYALTAGLAALACGLHPPTASGQSAEGQITGVIRDTSGAPVPGSLVTVHNQRTGDTRTATSTNEGRYVVAGLKPSLYTVHAALSGFDHQPLGPVQLSVGQELTLDVTLTPAAQSENVTVAAEASDVDLSSARMAATVNQRELTELPVNGRQLSQLYLQAPGALNSGTGTYSDIRFNGRANQQNVIRYDGVEGSAIIDASPGNLNGEIPSPFRLQSSMENVQEFRVDSSNFPAEYGTGTGGQITVVTKSGSNDYHGSAFEYFRDDALDSANAFDPVVDGSRRKSPLRQHQFGGSLGGPLVKDRGFFYVSYEGYRLDSGINFVEAVPSEAARARAVPVIAPLIDTFRSPQAILLPGASANPDFDIAQLQSLATVHEDAFNARLDFKLSDNHRFYARYFRDQGVNDQPEGVTGRHVEIKSRPQNAVVALQSTLSSGVLNEVKVGYNRADTEINGVAPVINGIDLSQSVLNITGSVANTGIAGQGSTSGVAVPGGLVRQNSASNGRQAPYEPYSLSVMDTVSWARGNHFLKAGAEFRMIRMETDRLGGTTYTWANLNDFLADRLQQVQYLGDVSEPSPFNGGATGPRHIEQEYYIGYVQDEWKLRRDFSLNVGVRYDYYTPLRERDDLDVVFSPDTGTLLPSDTRFFDSSRTNFQPRVSFTYAPGQGRTVVRGGFGMFVGPGQTEDQIQPIESDRIATSLGGGAYPVNRDVLRANFINNPLNRSYQPRAYRSEYLLPEKIYQYTLNVQQQLPYNMVLTAAYVGSQGRNLFLRSITNRIVDVRTNPSPAANAIVIREFDIVNPDGSLQRPYAEIDVKTTGGHDDYNALQLSLSRRTQNGLTLNAQYTLSRSFGNSAGSNEAQTAANNALALSEYDYDDGYNRFDVRHTLNLSALWSVPVGRGRAHDLGPAGNAILGNWDLGAIFNARSGLPIDVLVTRPDVVYRDAAGNVFGSPAAGRTAVINTPGGGASRNVRRPDLVPGVDPYLKDGLQWLNPAAFAIPAPGTFGNLQRGAVRGPDFRQLDLMLNKRIPAGGRAAVDFRVEVFNLFNRTNYAPPSGRINNALGVGTNLVQPGQPLTQAAAGSTFGRLASTVGTTVGLGTNRQVQFAMRLSF